MVTTRRGVSTTPSPPTDDAKTKQMTKATRTPPFLPTPLETIFLALLPIILVFGTLYSAVNPQTRAATYNVISQSYEQDSHVSPNYFARKSNILNVFFVKRGWAWVTFAFTTFVFSHPSTGEVGAVTTQRIKACLRWMLVTIWWVFVTQWCFGPALIDRGFRWTGGKCQVAEMEVALGQEDVADVITAVACKAAGGQWSGGHDISGHVFLLVLGTVFLFQEIGWPLARSTGWNKEERCIIMQDGALKGASVESTITTSSASSPTGLGLGGKIAAAVGGLNLWMLLMTAIYFHTWFEKLTGLLTALLGTYVVYFLPRFIPAIRAVIGMPGN